MAEALIDAGPIIALFNGRDQHLQRCLRWIEHCRDRLITTSGVLTECTHILAKRIHVDCAISALKWAQDALHIDDARGDLAAIIDIMERYRDLPADFVDAGIVALANRTNTFRIATVDDRDFNTYRGAGRQAFELIIPA
jgi:predicted nucleic acid-binding protein